MYDLDKTFPYNANIQNFMQPSTNVIIHLIAKISNVTLCNLGKTFPYNANIQNFMYPM